MSTDRIGRCALVGLAAVLLLLTVFSVTAAITTSSAADSAKRSSELSDVYSDALYAIGQEESIEHKYRLEPSPAIRAEFQEAAESFETAMRQITLLGDEADRALVSGLHLKQLNYLYTVSRVFSAVDSGDHALESSVDTLEADPNFQSIADIVITADDAHHVESLQALTNLRRTQRFVLVTTPIVFGFGLAVAVLVLIVFRAYQRQARVAAKRVAELTIEHVKATADAERQAIAQSERHFRLLVQHSSDVIMVLGPSMGRSFVSPSVERALGFPADQLVGEKTMDLRHPDDADAVTSFFAELRQRPGGQGRAEFRLKRSDGSWGWFEMVATNLFGEPEVNGIVINARDVTDRKEVEEELRRERDLLHLLMDSLPDLVFFKDSSSKYVRINRAGAAFFGLENPEQAAGKSDYDFLPVEIAAAYIAADQRVMSSREPIRDQVESIVGSDGSVHWDSTTIAPTFDVDGNVNGVIGVSRDVTERKILEEQLAHQAFHDSLTGLPNRMLFSNRLEHALERTARSAGSVAVLFVDLDGFKVVNDSLGHGLGDKLLTNVAERLAASVRPGDTVARLGGDEFTVLLEESTAEQAEEIAKRIARRFAVPLDLDGHTVFAAASIGIACKSSPCDKADEILRNADVAMYAAKQRGKSQYAVFDAGMHKRAWERLELESNLRNAIASGEFRVFYQPIIELDTGRTSELEALVRWEHPIRGLVPPSEFIPFAEETGLIMPIGWWVLSQACLQVREWQIANPCDPPLSISVNLSPRMFQHPALVTDVALLLSETGLVPARLNLEITEGVMMRDDVAAVATLQQLKELGVRLAIDDFGTGYSSLAYLQQLPIDVIKIDRGFIARMSQDSESLEIVRLIVGLAKTLGLSVVGEGVETEQQLELLRDLGGDFGQGYFFARPLSTEAASDHLMRSRVFDRIVDRRIAS